MLSSGSCFTGLSLSQGADDLRTNGGICPAMMHYAPENANCNTKNRKSGPGHEMNGSSCWKVLVLAKGAGTLKEKEGI